MAAFDNTGYPPSYLKEQICRLLERKEGSFLAITNFYGPGTDVLPNTNFYQFVLTCERSGISRISWGTWEQICQQLGCLNEFNRIRQNAYFPSANDDNDNRSAGNINIRKEAVENDEGEVSEDGNRESVEEKLAAAAEAQSNDPSSPLHSVKSFEELPLSEQLRRGVYDMGFNKPSKIQETVLPMLLADLPNNVIVRSQSGTEKTVAFVVPMVNRVDATKNVPQVICLSPTYEVALQTGQVAEKIGKFCPEVKIGYAIRGNKVSRGQKVTDQIIFATPETLLDWLQPLTQRVLDPKNVKMFVFDEADVTIAFQGLQDQSITIHKLLPKDCQMLLFSAFLHDEVMKFAGTVVPQAIIVPLRWEEESLDNIKQYYVKCGNDEDKFQALSNMYGVVSIGQCIVFCHTGNYKSASWLAEKMTAGGHSVALLSGQMTVEQRLAVLNRFRDGKEKLLITTTDCARAIDVGQVTVVVNYDMPVEPTGKPDFETYLHRICCTGRSGKSHIAVNFIDGPRNMAKIKEIEKHFGTKITLLQTNDVDELEKLA